MLWRVAIRIDLESCRIRLPCSLLPPPARFQLVASPWPLFHGQQCAEPMSCGRVLMVNTLWLGLACKLLSLPVPAVDSHVAPDRPSGRVRDPSSVQLLSL